MNLVICEEYTDADCQSKGVFYSKVCLDSVSFKSVFSLPFRNSELCLFFFTLKHDVPL